MCLKIISAAHDYSHSNMWRLKNSNEEISTDFYWAVYKGADDLAKERINAGAEVDFTPKAVRKGKERALHWAVMKANPNPNHKANLIAKSNPIVRL